MFKKLKELLEAGKITEELAKELDTEITVSLKEKNDENAKQRIEIKELKGAYDEGQEALKKEYETKLEDAKKSANSELQKEYETKLNEATTKGAELEAKAKSAMLKAELTSTLSGFDVVDMGVAESYVKGFVVENEQGGFSIKAGEETLNFKSGVEKLLNEKSFMLKPKGNAGSGAGGEQGFAQDTITAQILKGR